MPHESLALSIVIPCFNEAEGLKALCSRIKDSCAEVGGGLYELILVNDGSTDNTWDRMCEEAQSNDRIVAINLARNYGHQIALSAGLAHSRGQSIFVLDADLQDPPELIGAMMARMEETGADVVYGQRRGRAGESWFKRSTAHLFYRMLEKLTNAPAPVDAGDFRLMTRRVVDVLNQMPERDRYVRGMSSWVGFKQVPLIYDRHPRKTGESHYPFRKMIHFALDAFTGFSTAPLRLATYLGGTFGIIGLLLLLYVFASWISGDVVDGWTSLMVVVLILGSVQLLCLGVFGEYLGRLFMESKRRPLYVVERVVGFGAEQPIPPTSSSEDR